MKVVLLPEARVELREATDWYASRSPEVARRFVVDYQRTKALISETPERWAEVEPGPARPVRQVPVRAVVRGRGTAGRRARCEAPPAAPRLLEESAPLTRLGTTTSSRSPGLVAVLALAIAEERTEGFDFRDLEPGLSSPSSSAANGPAYPAPATYTYDLASGAIHYEEFHPYGTTAYRAANGPFAGVNQSRYRYIGKERDEETGLNHCGARYYASWLGRWTAADPIGLGDGVNRYTYVHGNPVTFKDPG